MDIIQMIHDDVRNGTIPELDSRLQGRLVLEGIPTIQHPLFYSPFYSVAQHRLYNYGFHQKLQTFKTYLRDGRWMSLLGLVERPFRIPVFAKYASRMSDKNYWHCLGWVYTDSENIDQFDDLMRDLLTSDRPEREHLMDQDELDALVAMPETLKIYKGFSPDYDWDRDFSFSLSEKVAVWFARRYGTEKPLLLEAEVEKRHVLAYFTGRNEEEILVDPEHVIALHSRRLRSNPALGGGTGMIHRAINRLA